MRADPIELEVFKHLFHAVAEEMGAALRRTAFSPNIKERRDYSCALFDAAGNVLAMGDHMPVHLGSMPMSVRAAIAELPLAPGDVAMLNDPFRGGTHLPDITVVAPVFVGRAQRKVRSAQLHVGRAQRNTRRAQPVAGLNSHNVGYTASRAAPEFFVAARAHHADVGGTYAGSMGPCREIYQEGLRIPPVKIVRAGTLDRDILALLLNNVRTPEEREGDLSAQLAACHTGSTRLLELCARYGLPRVQRAAHALLDYSEKMMRAFLATVPAGSYAAEDVLDDDGVSDAPVRIAVRITFPRTTKTASRKPRPVIIDFTGSSPQVEGSINAVEAITYSACFYVFRCLLREDVPATAGLMRPIQLIAPEGTVVNARPPAAVAGGNVETSQRIVDVLLRALAQALPQHIPAASSGTMNNLTIGGMDDRHAGVPRSGSRVPHPSLSLARVGLSIPFAYYETVAGGSGASAAHDGVSGVHTHMTNSLNTPAEALEYSYPLRVMKYALRAGSGGDGKHRGGDGIVREIEVLADATVTLLADRRKSRPYGLAGGEDGAPGRTEILRADGSTELMPSKGSTRLRRGERVRIETPGGGGWGKAEQDENSSA
ncbi:MAG: hydantoinase B/oxoprolinase family protein [Candidatus Korobacteraceae bacterium]|jgi:N-methylhydantoinase B